MYSKNYVAYFISTAKKTLSDIDIFMFTTENYMFFIVIPTMLKHVQLSCISRILLFNLSIYCVRVVWKSLLVLYAKDVLTDLVTIHHGQPRWQYCTQVSAMLFGEALSRLFLSSTAPNDRRKISDEVKFAEKKCFLIYAFI